MAKADPECLFLKAERGDVVDQQAVSFGQQSAVAVAFVILDEALAGGADPDSVRAEAERSDPGEAGNGEAYYLVGVEVKPKLKQLGANQGCIKLGSGHASAGICGSRAL